MKRVLTAMLMAASCWPIRVSGFSQLRNVASPNSLRSRPRTWAHWLANWASTPGALGLSSAMDRPPSVLNPRQTGGLPAPGSSSVALGIGVAFEAFGDVVTALVARRGQRHGGGAAASAAPADEQDRRVAIGYLALDLGDEVGGNVHRRVDLPRLEQRPLGNRSEIGQAHEGPFGARAHVDELRLGILGEQFPGLGRFQIPSIGHDRLGPPSASATDKAAT